MTANIRFGSERSMHAGVLVAGSGLVGYLLGRRHGLAAVFAVVAVGVVALGARLAALWPFVVVALVIVCVTRAHVRGWSARRFALTGAALAGAVVLVVIGVALAGIGGALVAGALAWAAWHVSREKVRNV